MIKQSNETTNGMEGSLRFSRTRELLSQFDGLLNQMDLSRAERTEVLAARELAMRAHYAQADRQDGQPYINHPLAVAITLMQTLGVREPDSVKAALLHDCVEDQAAAVIRLLRGTVTAHTDVRYEAQRLIRWAFGRRVGEIVDHLTNPDFHERAIQAQLKGDARTAHQLKHHFYKEHVVSLVERDPDAFLVKLADFYQNAFNLSAVRDPVVRAELGSKYGPVIPELIEKLERVPESGHPLSLRRASLMSALSDRYNRHFGAGCVLAA